MNLSPTRFVTLLALAVLPAACASIDNHAATEAIAADGIHIHHIRLRIVPAQTKDFEALVERCVEVAETAELSEEYNWLCYRESPGRYWLITFSDDRDGFAIPDSGHPLRTFARRLADLEGKDTRAEIDQRLAALEYEIEWSVVARQKQAWSTVEDMTTATHPKARIMFRTIRPGQEADFEAALAGRTAFLGEHDYPLPVEGFVILSGAPGAAMQVVFARDWPSFHAAESFGEFAKALPEADFAEYTRRKKAMLRTMLSAEYYDASFLGDASFSSE